MKTLAIIAAACPLLALPVTAADPPVLAHDLHVFRHENVLGTSLELKVVAPSAAEAQEAETAALGEIDRLAKILSGYDPNSEFSRWFKSCGERVRVSPDLFEVLGLFDQWRARTGGALDASAEVVCQLWKSAAARQQVPSPDEITAAVNTVRQPHWSLDVTTQTANHLDAAPLRLNSFAKSYIVNRACEAALAGGKASAAVVNIGGDLVVRGDLVEIVDITDPRADAENVPGVSRIQISNRAVATSGSYRRGVQIAGKWFSHIVDPRTGQPADRVIGATVVAPKATDAGALATAFCVLAPDESLRLAAAFPEVDCLIVTKDGQGITSPGWSRLEMPLQIAALGDVRDYLPGPSKAMPVAAAPAGKAWDSAMELVVTFELSRLEGQRAKRPFVAVWIEDQDKFPVRTLALWFNGGRWLPDLKSWYHEDQLRAMADGDDITRSVSSATRPPGKYSLKWDGKDNQGKLVKPGKYTVLIEAAREHGTYQLIRQEMEFSGTPSKVDLKGNVEIASASLEYRRTSDGH